jgi:hypothetical protein
MRTVEEVVTGAIKWGDAIFAFAKAQRLERPRPLAAPAVVLPHREAAWRILAERLEQLADRADRQGGTAGLGQLAELATDLHGMASEIASA